MYSMHVWMFVFVYVFMYKCKFIEMYLNAFIIYHCMEKAA